MSRVEERFEQVKRLYPKGMSASLVVPLLMIVQEEQGHVSAEDAAVIAAHAGVPLAQVLEALSWYTMLHRKPVGRHVIKVCRNIACSLRGAERLLAHVERRLGIGVGETSADGRFTFIAVECLASCGTAPAMQVNETYHEELTEEKIDRILKELP